MGCLSVMSIVALIAGFYQDGHGMKPQMSPGEDTVLIPWAEEFKIECYSKVARVQFSIPESRSFDRRSKHEINVSANGTYTLLLRNPQLIDAGWYACAEEGVKIDNDFSNVNHTDKEVSWIYVYVDHDAKNFDHFAETDMKKLAKTIISVPGSVVVIPCRPIQPTKNVELWQNFQLVDLEKEAVRFDPKIGFIMEQVSFSNKETIFECKLMNDADQYILRYSESKPTMITPSSEELILQEGDELRIECFSESKLSFLYPTILTNSSAHEMVKNKNGTSTFLRRSVISDDTGWYGCAGMDIGNNDIPAYSISYTKKGISWVYVYINSTVKIISPLVDTAALYYDTNSLWNYVVIPCLPTIPESHVQLERWNGKVWNWELSVFHPTVGHFYRGSLIVNSVYRCAMIEPVRYVSKNYSFADINPAINQSLKAAILDVDDPLHSDDLIIRMTGDDLRLQCETMAFAGEFYLIEWTVPSKVSASRIKYNHTRPDGYIDAAAFYLRRKRLTMMVTNLSETDSGKYICSVGSDRFSESDSRTVEVFDEAGARFLRLGKMENRFRLTGRKGEAIKWLLDLKDYPSARIAETFHRDQKEYFVRSRFEVKTASKHGTPLVRFGIRNLTAADRGSYGLFVHHTNGTKYVNIDVDVQEPPTVLLYSTKEFLQTEEIRIDARCRSFGSPEPNITIAIEECQKYPSLENCNFRYGRKLDNDDTENEWKISYRQFNINISCILTCEACNILGCSVATEHILFSASDEPYFTSTNLNKTEVVFDIVTKISDETLILECYAAGNPYPNVTWFKDDVKLEKSRQHKFAYDNRELSITYNYGDEGGRYACRAENVHGLVENYIDIRLEDSSDRNNVSLSSVIAGFVILLVLIIICCIVIYRQHIKASRKKLSELAFEKGALERFNPELSVVDQAELLPYDLKWEYPRGLLKLDKTLGSGAFGIVKKAEAKSICRGEAVTTVAVKLVRSTASLNFITALTRELKILAYLGKHPNVVNLLGACTTNVFFGELYVIVEYCRFGNLRDHLLNGRADFVDELRDSSQDVDVLTFVRDCGVNTNDRGLNTNVGVGEGSFATEDRCQDTNITGMSEKSDDDGDLDQDSGEAQRLRSKYEGDSTNLDVKPISTRDLVYWTWQVSRAMEFLGQRRIVHGDLAARNILLADNGIVKVCDFGLAKALYKEAAYRDTGANPLPVKWMAIESIKDLLFSVQSDVWSFGIVMWEIFSLGETPYPGMRQRGLVQKLIDGYRMGHPKYAASTIYDMMQLCWKADPTKRPSFADLSHNLIELLDYDFKTQYLEMHANYMEINAEIEDNARADYLTLSVDATSASRMQEQIEMNSLPQDVSENPAV